MADWTVPTWGDPWEPEIEVPLLQALGVEVEARWPQLRALPDFSTEGAAFVEFHLGSTPVARVCVNVLDASMPYYSCYAGAEEDEFHGYNRLALVEFLGHYTQALPESEA